MDKKLEGKWKVIACQVNGVWLPREIFKSFLYEIHDTQSKLHWAELSYGQWAGSFPKSDTGQIIPADDHRNITLIPEKGPNAGKTYEGIYDLEHDILKLSLAFPDQEKPSDFQGQAGQVYEVWQRID